MKIRLLVTALSVLVLCWPKTAAAQCSTFGGRATVVQANGLGIVPLVLSDTGNIDSAGGAKDASLLSALVTGLLSGEVLHATAIGGGTASRSESSIASLSLAVAGNGIGAGFVMSRANAYCGSAGSTVDGSSEIDALVVNGQSIAVTGAPNQVVYLLGGGRMILNEQTASGNFVVNAMHVIVPAVADVVIASSSATAVPLPSSPSPLPLFQSLPEQAGKGASLSADVVGGPPPTPEPGDPCPDRVTGGGWIITDTGAPGTGSKGTFGVAGGYKDGQPWGHLEYHDHGTGLNVHGTGVTSCIVTGPTSRQITGTAKCDGQSGFTYTVDVSDNGEPGRSDTFSITASCYGGYTSGPITTTLSGGNIQLHPTH